MTTKDHISLSRYFPDHTAYFYSKPVQGDSAYFEDLTHAVLELQASRPLVCAGPGISVVVNPGVMQPDVRKIVSELGILQPDESRIITLAVPIDDNLPAPTRNSITKAAIRKFIRPGTLIMAQPFMDPELKDHYLIDPETLFWCNDKKNMPQYIPADELPREYGFFKDGKAFAAARDIPVPCVVKITSSAGGEGVRICHTAADLQDAQKHFSTELTAMSVQEYIANAKNLCIQFGIPHDPTKPIEIIGFHEQIIGPNGEFLGGIVDPKQEMPGIERIYASLLNNILPKIRDTGWYGIGGLDVLITDTGKFYWIDPNLRLNATTCFLIHALNGHISKSMAAFLGTWEGSEEEFRKTIMPLAKFGSPDQLFNITGLYRSGNTWHINGAFLFDTRSQIPALAAHVIALGIRSDALEQLAATTLS